MKPSSNKPLKSLEELRAQNAWLGKTQRALLNVMEDLRAERANLAAAKDQVQRANKELARSNKDLEQFAYVASHDLKAPLRAIDNLAKWIVEDSEDILPPNSQGHLEQLQQRVQRMERFLDDLLQYSRAGHFTGHLVEVDLGEMVKDLVSLLSPREPFTVAAVGEMPTLLTASVPLEQCLQNLIDNAIRHHDRGDGRVEISSRSSGDFVEFTVADDGPGIAHQFHERIFEMFKTLHSRDEVEGSGMGLAVVKKLIEAYGGSIRVESSPPNGATFRFTWPTEITPQ
jgi:light-regulated signal transduction histidine kinase (bacteriophytochrome)